MEDECLTAVLDNLFSAVKGELRVLWISPSCRRPKSTLHVISLASLVTLSSDTQVK